MCIRDRLWTEELGSKTVPDGAAVVWKYVLDVKHLEESLGTSTPSLEAHLVQEDLAQLTLGETVDPQAVTENLILPAQGTFGSTIAWSSDKPLSLIHIWLWQGPWGTKAALRAAVSREAA